MKRAVAFPDDGLFGRFIRSFRHPLRALAMGLAAVALGYGISTTGGLVSAVLGAVGGVVVGEILGRSRFRLPAILGAFAVVLLVGLGVASLSTGTELVPSMVGPSSALSLSAILRYGTLVFVIVGALRSSASRYPAMLAFELGAVVTAVTLLFAAHRDGVIARPLWISDWAWQKGWDPANVFLVMGATSAVILAVLLVMERKSGRTISSLVSLPLLALLAVACLDVVGRPEPQAEDGLGLTTDEHGEPPEELPEQDHGNGQNQGRDAGSGGGQRGRDAGGAGGRPGGDSGQGPGPQHGDGGAGGGGSRDGGVGGGGGARDGGGGGGGRLDGGGGGARADGGGGGGGDTRQDGGGGGGSNQQGERDGGGGGSGRDGGQGGGGGDASLSDGGGGGSGRDAGMHPFSWDAGPVGEPNNQGGQQGNQQQQQQGGEQGDQQQQQQQQLDQESDQGPSSSPAPMAVVVLENDYSPPAQGYYFRQEAWSQFNGTRLVAATVDGADRDTLTDFPTRETAVDPPPEGPRARVSATVALLVDHQHPFALESPLEFAPIRNPNPERFTRAYRFESLAQEIEYAGLLGHEAGNPEWSDELAAMYLETHPDPRFHELAEQILEQELPERMRGDPFARALAIKLYLDRELVYSTRERHANVDDPTVDFLFGNRIGYCVHFSHAAVLLYREAGVPARIGTGYMVPEENRRGGSSILVRSADAHAWPEVYVKDVGWVVLDIAAERNLDEPGQPLDEDLQRMLGEMARDQPADPEEEVEEPEDEEPFDLGIELWVLLAILAGSLLTILYLIKAVRRVSPAFASGKSLARVAYRAYLDRLSEVGLSRELGETREAFAERVKDVAPSFAKMTELHVASRLSNPMKAASTRKEWDKAEWRALARAMRKELGTHVKLWRRIVGWLHPVSFLDSR